MHTQQIHEPNKLKKKNHDCRHKLKKQLKMLTLTNKAIESVCGKEWRDVHHRARSRERVKYRDQLP